MTVAATPTPFTIHPARTPHDFVAAATLFRAYYEWLNVDLTFQDFAAELASLPGKYAPSRGGELFLALLTPADGSPSDPVGCIALRDISGVVADYRARTGGNGAVAKTPRVAEVKRLYTLPAARGLGVGSALVAAIMDVARREGYDEVRLDTLPHMQGAIKLYSREGFEMADKYYDTDLEGTIFMKCLLKGEGGLS
ncbi:putative GNAT family N-acetyltransferase [Phyllosticta citribraziliensis]|uniref:GNAT family N-acetyltransferase n=1 Tax=Phyllosticta citribraziliensis TaxID=989973 RepID=A0ABR1LBH8_9PEZI